MSYMYTVCQGFVILSFDVMTKDLAGEDIDGSPTTENDTKSSLDMVDICNHCRFIHGHQYTVPWGEL